MEDMMRFRRGIHFAFCVVCCGLVSVAAVRADQLEDSIRKNMDPRNLDWYLVDSDFRMVSVAGSARTLLNKQQAMQLNRQVLKAVSAYESKNFRIIGRVSAGGFTTVVYEAQIIMKIGSGTFHSKVVAHEIWEHRDNEWFLLFAAQRE